jgi:hypothetical protein
MRIHPALLAGLIVLTGCAAPAPLAGTSTAGPRYDPGRYASTPAPAFETQSAGARTVNPPRIRLVDTAGELFDGMQSSFCWPQETHPDVSRSDLCADYMRPERLTIYMAHPAAAPVEIRFEGPAPDSANVALYADLAQDPVAHDTLTLSGGGASWPLGQQPPGTYVLQVSAWWDKKGDTSMFFGLILQ